MIRLFRKIRHKLLSEDSYGMYILYASGEIALVVIGILLALQIDNWNDRKKTQTELNDILDEIREDLVRDTSSISSVLALRIQDFEAQTRVIKAMQEGTPMNDQIRSDLARVILKRPVPLVSSGFSLLKEARITSIEERVFRSALIEYYEQNVYDMQEEYQDDEFEFETILLPYIRSNFKEWHLGKYATPINWDSVKKDPYFMTSLQINLNNTNSTIISLEKGLNAATNLIASLDRRTIKE